MLVADRRHDNAGGGSGEKGFAEFLLTGALPGSEHLAEIGALSHRFGRADIVDLTDHLWRREIADHLLDRVLLFERALEDRIMLDIGARPTLPCSAKACHPVADMEEKAFALLLAVIADVDSGLDLFWNDFLERGVTGLVDLGRIDCLAPGTHGIKSGERRRSRQAAGMGGENAITTSLHRIARKPCLTRDFVCDTVDHHRTQ